ncbi:MAG: hypothetical protein D6718_11450 [Acidobacteria bacterium]|nr:MAG: hypothetical protein D6718_11450 [Acidobacteriota bacterium]
MRKAAAAAILLALLSAGLGRGEWYDHYLDGVEALESGDPETAAGRFREAIRMRPEPGYYRTYGNNYLRYTPYFHLGAALHDSGDCAGALEAFRRSEESGELEDLPLLAARRRALREACTARLAPPASGGERRSPPSRPVTGRISRRALRDAVRAYLEGDYPAAEARFEALIERAPRSATLHAVLACVLAAKSRTGGTPADLDSARRALAEALELDPGLELDARYFSPLVRSLRPPGTGPAAPGPRTKKGPGRPGPVLASEDHANGS